MKYLFLALLFSACQTTPTPDDLCKKEVGEYKQSLDALGESEKALKACDK